MSFPEKHVLLTFGGGLASGAEQWVCGIRLRNTDPIGYPDHQAINGWTNNGLQTAVSNFWQQYGGFVPYSTTLTFVKANTVGTDGKYTDDQTNEFYYPTPIAGRSNQSVPTEVCVAVTFKTGITHGLAREGRIYLPTPTGGIGPDGRWDNGFADTVSNQVVQLLTDIRSGANLGPIQYLKPAVFSKVRSGAVHDITGVATGRVPDVQRSRRTKLKEAALVHTL